ncbi:alpha/beta fold hydrolase [Ulvibacterium marinum]|uniref:alpha/beta fold hydrolase n=1 Tax=Ulvibacterium marinum TaxID=2419782 RepID=UPI0024954D27|nr:alpha/beta fold hydrolase [Ulvibacterium marinum]
MQELHSKILGNGKPLIILHGFLGMSDNWKTLGSQYAEKGFEVHLIDQRNHGRSFWSEDFNYDLMAHDVHNYVLRHGLEKGHLMGHSMGGKTAMQFACTYPEWVNKLIVADIAPKYYPPHHQPILDALNGLDLDVLDSRGKVDQELSKSISETGTRQFLLKNLYWKEKGILQFRFNLKVLSDKMEEIGDNIGSSEKFEGATLFLRGGNSEYIAPDDIPEIKKHFPFAELDIIKNTGHWLHAENPKEFFEKSLSFLNR